mmetsp:Transcript_34767/g.75107  ORF Transcript_34767/g.75107 Transcript_34767/m.75107 type:complete len:488 (-) Transcript_34767:82-1545(-)
MWPFKSKSASGAAFAEDAPSPVYVSERTCILDEDDGTLSVIIAFIFLVVVFIICHLIYRGTQRENAIERKRRAWQLGKGLLNPHREVGLLGLIEKIFVDPFVPASLENFVLFIFFLWFVFTITMGITRYYRKIWAVEMMGQHGIFNYISFLFFGCKGKDLTTVIYTHPIPEHSPFISDPQSTQKRDVDVDSFIMFHITAAMAWLFLGFIQIYLAKDGWSSNPVEQNKVHRVFGCFAILGLIAHVFFATRIAYHDPMNQIQLIQINYLGMCVEVTVLCYYGIMYAVAARNEQDKGKKHYLKRMHRYRMVTCWIQGIFGSGAIRVTFWFLWMVGHFFSPVWRARIDRGACQSASRPERGQQLGSAESCWVPVALNLSLTNLLTTWLIWILFHLSEFTESDRASFIARLKQSILAVVFTIAAVPILYYWSGLELPIKIVLWPLSLISRMQCLWDLYVTFENRVLVRATRLTRFYHGRPFGNPEEQNEHAD